MKISATEPAGAPVLWWFYVTESDGAGGSFYRGVFELAQTWHKARDRAATSLGVDPQALKTFERGNTVSVPLNVPVGFAGPFVVEVMEKAVEEHAERGDRRLNGAVKNRR